jgi:hypothetical protein
VRTAHRFVFLLACFLPQIFADERRLNPIPYPDERDSVQYPLEGYKCLCSSFSCKKNKKMSRKALKICEYLRKSAAGSFLAATTINLWSKRSEQSHNLKLLTTIVQGLFMIHARCVATQE